MTTSKFIKKAWPKLIKVSGDPTAPIKIQTAYGAVDSLGAMLAGQSNRQAVDEISEQLLSKWTDAALDNICHKPEFVIALCSLLAQAIICYTNHTAR